MESRSPRGLPLLAPAFVILTAFFLWPLVDLVASSFAAGDPFEHYRRMLEVPTYLRVLLRTLLLSAGTAAICLLLGFPLAYRLVRAKGVGKALLLFCIFVPFWTNLLVRSYGWIVVLNPEGVINQTLMALGLIDEPLKLVYNTTGVLIGMSQIMLPYMVLPIAAVMTRLDPQIPNAARSLGATWSRAFWRIYFPLTLPGVMAGVLLVFMLSLGFFVIPAVLGASREILLSQLIEFNINRVLNWGFAAALSTVLLAATLLIYWIGEKWFQLGRVWRVE